MPRWKVVIMFLLNFSNVVAENILNLNIVKSNCMCIIYFDFIDLETARKLQE